MFNSILLYQTSNRMFALFLSFFMRMESVEFVNNGSIIPAQKIRSLNLINGNAPLKVRSVNSFGINSSYETKTIALNNMSFKTKGINEDKAIIELLLVEKALFSIIIIVGTPIVAINFSKKL